MRLGLTLDVICSRESERRGELSPERHEYYSRNTHPVQSTTPPHPPRTTQKISARKHDHERIPPQPDLLEHALLLRPAHLNRPRFVQRKQWRGSGGGDVEGRQFGGRRRGRGEWLFDALSLGLGEVADGRWNRTP